MGEYKMFENARWIWNLQAEGADTYVEFRVDCEFKIEDAVLLRISAHSNYAVYLNGVFVDSGQYADYPHYKVYDELDLGCCLAQGLNRLAIIVWYEGVPSFTRAKCKPGLLFELVRNGEIVLWSDEKVMSRKSRRYISGEQKMITPQLGLRFHVDLTQGEEWMTADPAADFQNSVYVEEMPRKLYPREVKKLTIQPRVPGKIVSQGTFSYLQGGQTTGERMQHAMLSFYRPSEMGSCENGITILEKVSNDGIYVIVDLEEETAGYLDFDIEIPEACRMDVGWGEHLEDGRCRTAIDRRNFTVSVDLQSGRNRYMNPFRRLGCRYVQFFIHSTSARIYYAGLRPTVYPVKIRNYQSGNILRDRIYHVSLNTLINCMHEHYEDCPWREQAFYTLDSRNQMLCSYYAFSGYEFVRASLRLIAQGEREDGMLPICFPADSAISIPSFTLFYIIQLTEYYRHSNDRETVELCFGCVRRIVEAFVNRIDESGLVPNLKEEQSFWNFYEWQPYMDGWTYCGESHDMCLNALLAWGLSHYIELCEVMGIDVQRYAAIRERLNRRIAEVFYDHQTGLFRICDRAEVDKFSVLANAWGYLCGAAEGLDCTKIRKVILENGDAGRREQIIPATLSMHTFRYEALLKADAMFYKDLILDQIDHTYFEMLTKGATSFWETEKGDKDFDFAGSLCHGWSAMPIYYYRLLLDSEF